MTDSSPQEQLSIVAGRLVGLAGTVRYELPDSLRDELCELAEALALIHLPTEVQ